MPRLSATRLTLPIIRALAAGDEISDAEIRGLTARASAAGTISYSLRYRADGAQRRVTLGAHPAITPDAARTMARDLLARVARGEDPSAERAAARIEPTLTALFAQYMEAHGPQLTAKTREEYARNYRIHIAPKIGDRRISSIVRSDIQALHTAMRADGIYAANKNLRILGSFFTWAENVGLVTSNPAAGIKKYREEGRERFLSQDERRAVWAYLDHLEAHEGKPPGGGQKLGMPSVRVIRMCLLTGARKGEVISMRWTDLDLDRGIWRLPTSKTGRSDRPLLPMAIAYLRDLYKGRDSISPLVCPSAAGGPVTSVDECWGRIRKALGIHDVRLHDLRHSLASDALAAGLPLAVIGKILGHKQQQSTARYAHLADDVAAEAAKVVSERLEAIHGASPTGADVLPLRRR
jgi:integrase